VSRNGKGFGNMVLRELSAKGYDVTPVHPVATAIDGRPCVSSLAALPRSVGGVVVVVPPVEAVRVMRDAAAAGIKRVWLQQGASSSDTARVGLELGLEVVAGECILMFAEPVRGGHAFHRWIWKIFGKLPV
jgi:predicted CoA-binding protein